MPVPVCRSPPGGDRAYTCVTAVDRWRFELRDRLSPGVAAADVRTTVPVFCDISTDPVAPLGRSAKPSGTGTCRPPHCEPSASRSLRNHRPGTPRPRAETDRGLRPHRHGGARAAAGSRSARWRRTNGAEQHDNPAADAIRQRTKLSRGYGRVESMVRVEPASREWAEALAEGDTVFTERFGIPVQAGWSGFGEAVPILLPAARSGMPGRVGAAAVLRRRRRAGGQRRLEGPPAGGGGRAGLRGGSLQAAARDRHRGGKGTGRTRPPGGPSRRFRAYPRRGKRVDQGAHPLRIHQDR